MNRFDRLTIVCCLLFVFVALMPGCGDSERPAGFPKLYPVSLKVTQEGTPLAKALVSLKMSDGSMVWSTGGVTNEQGIVVLWTHGKFRGAPEGKFKVIITKIINEGEEEMLAAADREDYMAAAKIPVNSYSCVKDEYESFEKTPLEIEITKKSRKIDIDAGTAVKIKREYMR